MSPLLHKWLGCHYIDDFNALIERSMVNLRDNMGSGVAVFTAVVDAGSFSAAAEAVGLSAPGVSRAIARLEQRLGVRLFHRTTRSMALTEEGRRFHDAVLPHLAGLEEAAAELSGHGAPAGRLRVNIDPVLYGALLGPPLDDFLQAHPRLSLELIARDRLGDLVGEGFDLALRFGMPASSSLVARRLLESRVVTVASPAYLQRHGHPASPQALAGGMHRCLEFRDPATGKPYDWEFQRGQRSVQVVTGGRLTVNDPSALLSACLAGSGIAQLLELVAAPLLAQQRLVDLFPQWSDETFPLYAYHPSRHHVPARTRAFLERVVACFGGVSQP